MAAGGGGGIVIKEVLDLSNLDFEHADLKLYQILDKNGAPQTPDILAVDCLLTGFINCLHIKLLTYDNDHDYKTISSFNINRATECKKRLLIFCFQRTRNFYIPFKPDNLTVPVLDQIHMPIFPHQHPRYKTRLTSDMFNLLLISNRIATLLKRLIPLTRPMRTFIPILLDFEALTSTLDLDINNHPDLNTILSKYL